MSELKNKCLILLKSRPVHLFIGLFGVTAFFVSIFLVYFSYYPREICLGVISDIHAGDQEDRFEEDTENILFPKNFEKNVSSALQNMKACDYIMVLGDNLNRPSRKNTKKLAELFKGYKALWVKGNHDKPKHFSEFLSNKTYYYVDKGPWRIIVIDNTENYPDLRLSDKQTEWLKKTLKTRKKIIIAMHIPIFYKNTETVDPAQEKLMNLFSESGNIVLVLSGHFHKNNFTKEVDGVKYQVVPSVSLKDHEGQYTLIDLKQ